jgi:hypothetical protein
LEWPDYNKGASAAYLRARLFLEQVRQAAKVETELANLLAKIGYFQNVRQGDGILGKTTQ